MQKFVKTSYDPDSKIDALVDETIARVADKWTLLLIEALEDVGARRFSELARAVPGISQKMLTQTLRAMEREGLVTRTIFPEVPPRVEAFCGVWTWAERNLARIEAARAAYDAR